MLHWDKNTRQLRYYQYETETGGLSETTENLRDGQSRLYHNLGNRADSRFSLYTNEFISSMSEQSMDDFIQLAQVMDPLPSGVLVMVTNKM